VYTGIVQASCPIVHVERKVGLHTLTVSLPVELLDELVIGASVGMDGVCLTVTVIDDHSVSFDVMQQTLSLTTLGELDTGSVVNIERSAKQGVEIGGHILSGHIDNTVKIVAIDTPENNHIITYQIDPALMPYVFSKGFVGLNGCSLTVASIDKALAQFSVCLIPETMRITTHGMKRVGDRVNVEIDRQTQVIVDTVKAFLAENIGTIASLP